MPALSFTTQPNPMIQKLPPHQQQKRKRPHAARRKTLLVVRTQKPARMTPGVLALDSSSSLLLDIELIGMLMSSRRCDICKVDKCSTFRPVISDWIGKQRLLPDAMRVMSCNPCYCRSSHPQSVGDALLFPSPQSLPFRQFVCEIILVASVSNYSHSKHNPSWNAMKVKMLLSQLKLFLDAGITRADVRMGYDGTTCPRKLDQVCDEIKGLSQEREIREGEIVIRPHLPDGWDTKED